MEDGIAQITDDIIDKIEDYIKNEYNGRILWGMVGNKIKNNEDIDFIPYINPYGFCAIYIKDFPNNIFG